MKCNQSRPGFELVSSCPFPTTITITPWACMYVYIYIYILCMCMYVYIFISCVCVYIYIYILWMWMCICVCVCVFVLLCVWYITLKPSKLSLFGTYLLDYLPTNPSSFITNANIFSSFNHFVIHWFYILGHKRKVYPWLRGIVNVSLLCMYKSDSKSSKPHPDIRFVVYLCSVLTCIEIKTEIWFSFSN